MALSRSWLASKGIEASVIEEIITKHTETVSGLKDDLDKANSYKAKAEKYEATKKELDDLKAEVDKNGGKSYVALKEEFDNFKAEVAKKEARTAKETAYKKILEDAGIPERHFAKILKYSDVDGVELDDNGQIKTKADILKSIKEEWADHIEKKAQKGADVKTPPQGAGGKQKLTEEEIYKTDEHGHFVMDATARQAALAELINNEAE